MTFSNIIVNNCNLFSRVIILQSIRILRLRKIM